MTVDLNSLIFGNFKSTMGDLKLRKIKSCQKKNDFKLKLLMVHYRSLMVDFKSLMVNFKSLMVDFNSLVVVEVFKSLVVI